MGRRVGSTVALFAVVVATAGCVSSVAAKPPSWSNGKGSGKGGNGGNQGKGNQNGACDCEYISLRPGPPVCGDDGIEYINSCLAECQGISVVKNGRCPGNSGKPEWLSVKMADADGYASLAEILEFKSEGFKMVGRFKGRKIPKGQPAPRPEVVDDPEADALKPDASEPESFEVRFTPSGNSFVRKSKNFREGEESLPAEANAPRFVFQPEEDEEDPHGKNRKLLLATIVGGTDDRVEHLWHGWPFSAVGVVGGRCSGALIGPSSVLTAGHCVYDLMTRTYLDGFDFRPNAHRGEEHMARSYHSRPTYKAKYVSTVYHNAGLQSCGSNTACSTFKDWTFDYAVIELEEQAGWKQGWFGLRYECGPKALNVWTAGYPGDKPGFPAHMYKVRGTMDPFDGCFESVENGHIKNNLDSAVGQSGSPVWDSDKYIRAIINNSLPGSRTITRHTYYKITTWMREAT